MRCLTCAWYKYDFFDRRYDDTREPFCGLHGGARVNPSRGAKQMNLDNRGGCGYCPKVKVRQLKLF
jgi:hypothetical protein